MDQRSEAAISRRDSTMNDARAAIMNGARSSLRRCGQGGSEGKREADIDKKKRTSP